MPRPTYGDRKGPWQKRAGATGSERAEEHRDFARTMRRKMSLPEVLLWQEIRSGQCSGWRFRRQHAIGPYTADFYCHELRLVIEIDGSDHDSRVDQDARRDEWLKTNGYRTLRVPAQVVLDDPKAATARLANWILRVYTRSESEAK